jgi:hypothetical protein
MMGYPMARNVRRKIPAESKLYIYDVVPAALERFVAELGSGGGVVIVSSTKEVVDNAVRTEMCKLIQGHRDLHVTRRSTCQICLS